LWSGTSQDAALRRRAFAGLKRFQTAQRPTEGEPRTLVAQNGRASLLTRKIDGVETKAGKAPVILVPSLINPPDVLDLTPRRSLLRHLLRAGHETYMLAWGEPDRADAGSGFTDHIDALLIPLIKTLDRPPILVGYCLGGTLAIGAAARLAAAGTPVRALASIATPWDFAQYGADFRAQIDRIWGDSKASCEALGLVPMEVLQSGFWSLDPDRTIRKYADFGEMDADTLGYHGFITLEDWANEGAPLTLECGRDLIDGCYQANRTGTGDWTIGDTLVDPARLACPTLAIASTQDAIVPAATTPPADERLDLALGHVGMMIGSRAQSALWAPLSDWITRHGG
jgi:polyhydroxyalkanoate synthase